MAGGESSSAMRDVERGGTPSNTRTPEVQEVKVNEAEQKTEKPLSNKDIEGVRKRFNDFIDTITVDNTSKQLEEFNGILTDVKIKEMEACYEQEEKNLQNVLAHLPGQKSFLNRFSLQEVLLRMLKDVAKYAEFLKLFIERFKAHKEHIESKNLLKNDTATGKTEEQKDKTKKQRRPKINNDQRTMRELDTPLHCAVRQLNKGFIEWLLEQPETEVNLRNKRRETALAILCAMYDWYKELVPKLKTRVNDIEKEREKADKMQQIWLDDEKIEVTNQMNAPTHIMELIKILLVKGADFNIYINDGALPFDFLRKYDKEADVAEIINSYTKSNVAMTENPPKPLNASAEGKNVSKKRIVKFYKKTEDMDVRVTVELLEIFIWFQDLEKFKHYWKDFKVTGDNVKKVITLLLHVAVELNYTTFVDHIIKKASKEIFKLDENKAKQNKTIEPQDNIPDSYGNRAETTPMSAKVLSRWRCFKCCQKRYYPGSQTHGEEIELRASDSQDKCEFMSERSRWCCFKCCQNRQNPSSSEGVDFQMQGETFKQEKNEIGNSQDTCAGTSKRICMNAGGSCKDNPSATEDAEPRTESGTSKLPATDPPVSQDTTAATPTSDEQPSGWCCLKCFQKKQNPSLPDGTNPQAQRQNSKNCRLPKAEGNQMVHRYELRGLLKVVCLNGNKALLAMFLEKMNDRLLVNENPLLINTLNGAYTVKSKKESSFLLACIRTLIDNHRKVDMYCVDMNGNTALHLALSYGYENLALLVLKHAHGLMGRMNNQYFTPIDYGRKQFWDDYLDNCITAGGRTELKFNVNFLKPLPKKESIESKAKVSCCGNRLNCLKLFKPMKELHNSQYRFTRTVNDMTALRLISQSKDRKEFLMHPVISAFIIMKWERLCHWNILNFLLTTITMFTFASYTLLAPGSWKNVSMGCTIFGALILLLREITQGCLRRWSYFTLENVVDMINLLLIGIVLGCEYERSTVCRSVPILSSFVVVSLSLQAIFLLGASWNSLSITLYMFKTVSISFFKSFLCFTPVIGAFIYSFYRTNNDSSDSSATYYPKENSQNKSYEKNFNSFPSFLNATIKTLVMTTGEFEAANIEFDGGKWMLFIAFVFVAPIVILNLINGLAVSDIAAIRQESEFISIYRKVKLLERYERAVINYGHKIPGYLQRFFRDPWFPGPFFEKHESLIYLNTSELNQLKIQKKKEMSPNSRPRLIPGFFVRLFKFKKDRYFGFRSYEKSLFATLDQSYVDKAMAIVSKRVTITSDETTSPSTADTRDTGNDTLQRQISKNNGVPATLPPSQSEDQSGDQ